jgi:uncharacterized protein (TIGR02246 family)
MHQLILNASKVVVAMVAMGAMVSALASGPAASKLSLAETEALAAMARSSDEVWNRRDAAALAATYASDANSTISGVQLNGRPAILDYFTKSFKNVPAGMTHRTVIKRLEKMDGDLVAVDSAVYLEVPDGADGKRVVREFFTFGLLRKAGNGWEMMVVRAIPLGAALPRPAA